MHILLVEHLTCIVEQADFAYFGLPRDVGDKCIIDRPILYDFTIVHHQFDKRNIWDGHHAMHCRIWIGTDLVPYLYTFDRIVDRNCDPG